MYSHHIGRLIAKAKLPITKPYSKQHPRPSHLKRLTLEQCAAKSFEKNAPKAAQSLPETLVVKLTLYERRWLLQCLKKLHTGEENPLRFVFLESFKGKPEVWKQIEKDGKPLPSPVQ